ncbi:MAG: hypothetical protein IJ662_00305 [Clostridia bacterium]|nr:hypothetical protein [Clostridia bacterium]
MKLKRFAALLLSLLMLLASAPEGLAIGYPNDPATCPHTNAKWTEVSYASCDHKHHYYCRLCPDCGSSGIEKTASAWGSWTTTKKATCGAEGTQERTCSICGKKGTKAIAATGKHTWSKWETTKKATCGDEGIQARTCSVCGKKETKAIAATGKHTWGKWTIVKKATATKAGTRKHTCSVCGKTETVSYKATATPKPTKTPKPTATPKPILSPGRRPRGPG